MSEIAGRTWTLKDEYGLRRGLDTADGKIEAPYSNDRKNILIRFNATRPMQHIQSKQRGMQMREVFDAQHREMLDLATAILAVVDDCPSRSSDPLNRLRLALSKKVTVHCQEEAIALQASRDIVPPEIMRRYHDELLKWRRDLISCNSDWPPERVWSDPSGFKSAFRPVANALRARILWEQGCLYPIIMPSAP